MLEDCIGINTDFVKCMALFHPLYYISFHTPSNVLGHLNPTVELITGNLNQLCQYYVKI